MINLCHIDSVELEWEPDNIQYRILKDASVSFQFKDTCKSRVQTVYVSHAMYIYDKKQMISSYIKTQNVFIFVLYL